MKLSPPPKYLVEGLFFLEGLLQVLPLTAAMPTALQRQHKRPSYVSRPIHPPLNPLWRASDFEMGVLAANRINRKFLIEAVPGISPHTSFGLQLTKPTPPVVEPVPPLPSKKLTMAERIEGRVEERKLLVLEAQRPALA